MPASHWASTFVEVAVEKGTESDPEALSDFDDTETISVWASDVASF